MRLLLQLAAWIQPSAKPQPRGIWRLSQSRSPFVDDVPKEFDEIEEEREKLRQKLLEQYNLSPDDDDEVFEQKLKRANEDGALNGLLLDAYFDDSNDAYW